jgi:mRNA interferase RelE/StbE
MKINVEKTFVKDIERIKDKSLLVNLQNTISKLNEISSQSEIANLKKLSGKNNYYRIRIGNYRIGISIIDNEINVIRFLHRKDIYKYFP